MNATPLRIAIAEDVDDHRDLLSRALQRLGHLVVAAAKDGQSLPRLCEQQKPDLVITDIGMPEMDGLDAAEEIYQVGPVPIIVVSAHYEPEFVERAQQHHILSFLVKPISEANLAPAIALALHRFAEFEALKVENANLSQSLADRKIIERAKGLLMKQANLDEPTAFQRLQRLARNQRKKIADVAEMVVQAAELMNPKKGEKLG